MEIRNNNTNFEIQDRLVEGYAVVFNQRSTDLGWIEVIHPEAITQETIDKSDVLAKFNHDDSKVLARSKFGKGSLTLTLDERGLKYSFESPKTALGDEVLEYLHRGDITGSSFAFTINKNDKDSERWHKEGNVLYRDIYRIERLFDVSPVFSPAYETTTCSARFDEIKANSDEVDKVMDVYKDEINNL